MKRARYIFDKGDTEYTTAVTRRYAEKNASSIKCLSCEPIRMDEFAFIRADTYEKEFKDL